MISELARSPVDEAINRALLVAAGDPPQDLVACIPEP
jgi:hypothetical protein